MSPSKKIYCHKGNPRQLPNCNSYFKSNSSTSKPIYQTWTSRLIQDDRSWFIEIVQLEHWSTRIYRHFPQFWMFIVTFSKVQYYFCIDVAKWMIQTKSWAFVIWFWPKIICMRKGATYWWRQSIWTLKNIHVTMRLDYVLNIY